MIPLEKAEQDAFVKRCRLENIMIISVENSLQMPINAILDIVKPYVKAEQIKDIKFKLNKLMAILTKKRYSQGMLKGVPDLFLPDFDLFIEMKKREGGVVSKEQIECHKELIKKGYKVEVCKGAKQAWEKTSHMASMQKNSF